MGIEKLKELERYLSDLDNLIETNHFHPNQSVKDYTFHHKNMTLKEFVEKGRELIRQLLMIEKSLLNTKEQPGVSKKEITEKDQPNKKECGNPCYSLRYACKKCRDKFKKELQDKEQPS